MSVLQNEENYENLVNKYYMEFLNDGMPDEHAYNTAIRKAEKKIEESD